MAYQADSGDILLFQGDNFAGKMNQFFQSSEYGKLHFCIRLYLDHVGMLLRYASGKVVLFEAIGGTGVTLTDWNDFIDNKWHHAYKKIVYRKLIVQRTPEMLTEFENFIKVSSIFEHINTLFRPHSANPTKLIRLSYAVIRKISRRKVSQKRQYYLKLHQI